MKRIAFVFSVGLLALLVACSTTAPQQLTPQQIIAIACPPIQGAVTQFIALDATMSTLPAAVQAEAILKEAQPPLAAACTAGATVTMANVQDLATKVLPAVGTVMATIPVPPATQAAIQAGLVAAEIAVGAAGVIEQQVATQKAAAAAPASSATVQ
jgi:hypothetical protein